MYLVGAFLLCLNALYMNSKKAVLQKMSLVSFKRKGAFESLVLISSGRMFFGTSTVYYRYSKKLTVVKNACMSGGRDGIRPIFRIEVKQRLRISKG